MCFEGAMLEEQQSASSSGSQGFIVNIFTNHYVY
jgi:hypothetical protein